MKNHVSLSLFFLSTLALAQPITFDSDEGTLLQSNVDKFQIVDLDNNGIKDLVWTNKQGELRCKLQEDMSHLSNLGPAMNIVLDLSETDWILTSDDNNDEGMLISFGFFDETNFNEDGNNPGQIYWSRKKISARSVPMQSISIAERDGKDKLVFCQGYGEHCAREFVINELNIEAGTMSGYDKILGDSPRKPWTAKLQPSE